MKIKYLGNYEIKFLSIDGSFNGVVKPNDIIEIQDKLYEEQYKNDNRWEVVGTKQKSKYSKQEEGEI